MTNGLTHRRPYRLTAEEQARQPVALDSLPLGRSLVEPGKEVTVRRGPGTMAGQYEVQAIERRHTGEVVLTVFGPLRKRCQPRRRYLSPDVVTKVAKHASRG